VRRFRESLLAGDAKTGKGKGALAPATVRKYMNLLGTVFHHAVRTGLLDVSPVAGMAFVVRGGVLADAAGKRQPFSAEQLRTLFASRVYQKDAPRDALWWLFPLGLYTGCRMEEVMALRAEDVREIDGILCFVIEPRSDRPLKTSSSRRVVPVHDALIDLGLIRKRVEGKSGLLFPELRRDARHGTYTAALSKKAGRLLRSLGLSRTVTSHSARHCFADALRAAKVEPEVRARLLGHSLGSITERYGRGHPVNVLRDAVNVVRYEGLVIDLHDGSEIVALV